jgi:hypothetical protein
VCEHQTGIIALDDCPEEVGGHVTIPGSAAYLPTWVRERTHTLIDHTITIFRHTIIDLIDLHPHTDIDIDQVKENKMARQRWQLVAVPDRDALLHYTRKIPVRYANASHHDDDDEDDDDDVMCAGEGTSSYGTRGRRTATSPTTAPSVASTSS